MSVWMNNRTVNVMEFNKRNNEMNAQMYLARLMEFPENAQDEIIDKISDLQHCDQESISAIFGQYQINKPMK